MAFSALCARVAPVQAGTIDISLVTVGDPGNAPDPSTGYGSVPYIYQIGEFDITVSQYCQFLNDVAKADPYGLYNPSMAPSPVDSFQTLGISRSGSSGHYSYSVAGSYSQAGNCPIYDVTWGDAARFTNWLQNGRPTGAEGPGTTETGTYALNGGTSSTALMAVTRSPTASWVIPNLNEWYKSAYYSGSGINSSYWTYATQSNTTPSNVFSAAGTNNANFLIVDNSPPNYGATDPVNGLTPVGAFADSPSAYGTYDENGDVYLSPAEIEGSFTDSGSVQEAHNVTIVWGDGSPNTTFAIPAGQTTFNYPLQQYAGSGEYTVQVSVADADDSHATSPVSVDVYYASTQPSGLTLTLDESTVTLGDAVNLGGSFNDPQSSLAHTVTIVWNTGGGTLDVTTLSLGAGETTFQADPQTYSATGTHTISVTVSGLDGTTATGTTSVTVIAVPEQVMIGSLVPTAWEYGDSQPGTFLLTRVGSMSGTLTVNYTVKGTAPGADYNLTGTATFESGDSTTSIYVAPTGDGGNGDTVVVTLAPGSGYTVASGFSSGQVTISNNDFTGSGAPGATVTCFNPDGTAEGSSATTMLGSFIPVSFAASGDTTGCTYYLSYSGDVLVSATPGGTDILSGTEITLTSAGSVYYVSALEPDGESEECGIVGISFTYDEGASGGGTSSTEKFKPLQLVRTGVPIGGSVKNVNITDDARGLDSIDARIAYVGEKVSLSVVGTLPTLLSVYAWDVPGMTISSFYVSGDKTKGFPLPMLSTPFSSSVKFDWVNGGNKLVSVGVADGWGDTWSAYANFTVLSPQIDATASFMTNQPDKTLPQQFNASQNSIVLEANKVLRKSISLGVTADGPKGSRVLIKGVKFSGTPVNAEEAGKWQYCFAQVVSSFNATRTVNSKPYGNLPPASGLDSTFPYGDLTHKGIFDALNIATEDTPTSFIYSEGGTLVYSASFTTWLMCEPKDLPGDWVPLKQITWSVFVSAKWPTGSESPIIGANSKVFVVGGAPGEATRVGSAALYTPYAFSDSIVFPVWFTICNTAVGPKK